MKPELKEELPRLPIYEDKSALHPFNLIDRSFNVLIAIEESARRPNRSAYLVSFNERLTVRDAEDTVLQADIMGIRKLKSEAIDRSIPRGAAKQPFYEKLQTYHGDRATRLGAYAMHLEQDRPIFAGLRKVYAEKRQSYHQHRANKAASRLIASMD